MSLPQDLFITIVDMSIIASFVAFGVILVRLLLRKVPKVFSYVLWAAVFFRLICPFSFTSDFSILALMNTPQSADTAKYLPHNIGFMQTPTIQSGIDSIDNAVNASLPQAVPAASANPTQIWMAVLSLIWITGVLALLIYSVVSYVKIKGRLQTATLVEGNVFETDAIGTAFVCGFIRPKIYVPANIGDANLSYILEHEHTHIRRKDYLIKPLAFLALILHWFNPLMWLCFALMSRDMEMSCDESVLNRLGEGAKGGYSGSLLSLAVKKKGLLAANPLAFGEVHVKARIKNVLSFKEPAIWVIMIAVVAVCSAVVAFTANPSKEGTISAEDKRKLAAVVTEYYLKADPANKGTLRIYNIKKYGSGYLVLTEKYRGEGESFSVLFLVNHDFNIVAKAPGDIPKSPCFSANVVKYQGKSIVYGNFKNKKWNPQTDLVVDVQIDFIKIAFEDGTYIREQVSMDKGYIVVVDTLSNIRNIEVYNSKGELQSDLLNESSCSEFSFIRVENETVGLVKTTNPKYGALLDTVDTSNADVIKKLVEENLAVIMSSPKEASNPYAYIQAHQDEYGNIKKFGGEKTLQYMLSQFESGNADGLRGVIMMQLCKELLGVRNNVTDETLNPQEWYGALSIRQEVKLPDFEYDGNDPIEKLVYATEIEKNSEPHRGFTIVAPKIFGSYEEGDWLRVFVTTYSKTYRLYGNVLDDMGGSIIPAAITYKNDGSGNFILSEYERAKDGSYFGSSIREYCIMPVSGKEIPGLADEIFAHYGNCDDIRSLQWENLFKHLKANGIKDATLFNSRGEIEFSMSNPQYIN